MEISRLIFTKETKEKLDKGISAQAKGKLRWEKLKEAENNGTLQQAKSRLDVGKIVGLDNDKTAYRGVSGLIHKKAIVETLDSFENNKAVYTYHLGKPLSYVNGRKKRKEEQIRKIQTEAKRQDLINNDHGVMELGKIKFDKLKKLGETGELLKANCRGDVVKLIGYNEDEFRKGYSWVNNMIVRGHLNERTLGVTPSGKVLYEYSLTGTQPRYYHEEQRNKKTRKEVRKELRQPVEQKNASSLIKLEITKGDITIRAEFAEVEQVTNLITTIMKGE
jgi:hypothetical protein